jgi:cell fate (sporulation/competence/biofilm development) regulator YlbF (YheA/YmcA/DUF963 family)
MKYHTFATPKQIAAVVLTLVAAYFLMTTLVQSRFNELEQNTRLAIADQQSILISIAEVTARNGADPVTESVVMDCSVSERTEFDTLLGSLNGGLKQSELATLERLFGRCGAFYAQRKAVMVSRLTREIEVYETYVTQLSAIVGSDLSAAFSVEEWKSLVTEEKKQSDLFTNLVRVQDQIITTLLSGKSATSPEIQDILQQAREIQETLLVANKQASTLRAGLISL